LFTTRDIVSYDRVTLVVWDIFKASVINHLTHNTSLTD